MSGPFVDIPQTIAQRLMPDVDFSDSQTSELATPSASELEKQFAIPSYDGKRTILRDLSAAGPEEDLDVIESKQKLAASDLFNTKKADEILRPVKRWGGKSWKASKNFTADLGRASLGLSKRILGDQSSGMKNFRTVGFAGAGALLAVPAVSSIIKAFSSLFGSEGSNQVHWIIHGIKAALLSYTSLGFLSTVFPGTSLFSEVKEGEVRTSIEKLGGITLATILFDQLFVKVPQHRSIINKFYGIFGEDMKKKAAEAGRLPSDLLNSLTSGVVPQQGGIPGGFPGQGGFPAQPGLT